MELGLDPDAMSWCRNAVVSELYVLLNLLHGFSPSNSSDSWDWCANADLVMFMVKGLRMIIELNRIPVDLNPVRWLKWVPLTLKMMCFIWKCRLNKIPCKKALATRRSVTVSSEEYCSLCFGETETLIDHLLLRSWETR